jgi:ATP-dependent DNA helicase RecG
MDFDTPIEKFTRVSPAYKTRLKNMGILTMRDLLYHFPTRYQDFSSRTNISELEVDKTSCVQGTVENLKIIRIWKRHMTLIEAMVTDATGTVKALWFNQPYLANTLKKGTVVCLAGKLVDRKGAKYLSNPMYEKVRESFETEEDYTHTGRLVPVYPETAGVSSRWLRYIIKPLLAGYSKMPDPLPENLIDSYEFMPWTDAIKQIHFPESEEFAAGARKRFAFEELFFIQLAVLRERVRLNNEKALSIPFDAALIQEFVKSLPFTLTQAQRKTTFRILKDMEKPRPMNRLLQGDVGSGKTIVAMIAALAAAKAGSQTAIMVPTEILAQQHYANFTKMMAPFNIEIGLLCSKNSALSSYGSASKTAVLEQTKNGDVAILIGTNALIQKGVEFKNLSLVVLDEQHRFGIDQRAALAKNNKSNSKKSLVPHLLSMTATPIPRTLALTVYGDLDLALINEMPAGRKRIETKIILPDDRAKAYEMIRKEIKAGRQAFVICPRIEDTEVDKPEIKRDGILFDPKADWSGADAVKAVKVEYEKLSKEIFPELRVGMMHGKMKVQEKEEVMTKLKDGLIDILVSTSVIEVGIDIPNATVMAIEGSHKFGLAQLHQFRGRVGRGEHQSYCLLFSDYPTRRLSAMLKFDSGFDLAEKDLEIRGPGEVFGSQQWGAPDLAMASLADVFLVEKSRNAAKAVLANDPTLIRHPQLRNRIQHFRDRAHLE